MPTRNFQGFTIAQGSRGPSPTGGSVVPVNRRVPGVRPSVAGQALQGILSFGEQLANQNFAAVAEGAYLEGQRQRSLGTALGEIEGDVFARPFIRGGYAAQDYRLNQAKFVQEMQAFIDREGRTLTPEEFTKSLRDGSEQIIQSIGPSMSREDRAKALASQAQAEQAIIQYQAKAHAEYGLEQVSQRYTVQGNQITAELTQARDAGDPDAYVQAAARASMFLDDVLNGDSLPSDMRPEVAAQYVLALLSTDHADLVEAAIGDGSLDTLPQDARVKIDTALRESRSRTLARDSLAVLEGNGQFYERVAEGRASVGEVRAFVEREVLAKRMTVNEAEALYRQFYKSPSDHGTNAAIYGALIAGDINSLHSMGTTPSEAILKMDQDMATRGYTLEQRTAQGIRLGMQLGEIPRQLGQRIAAATNAVAANPDAVNPSQVALLNATLSEVSKQEVTNPAAAQVLLGALPEKERAVVAYALSAAKQGVAPVDAIRTATANTEAFSALQESRKRRVGTEFRESVQAKLDGEFGAGALSKLGAFLAGKARPTDDPWTRSQLQLQVSQEVRRLADNPDNLALFSQGEGADEALIEMAVANVQSRTLRIAEEGRLSTAPASFLVLPQGVTPAAVFGDAPLDFVSSELAKQYPAQSESHTSTFRIDPITGKLQNLQVNEQGIPDLIQDVDVQAVRERASARQEEIAREERFANFGGGHVLVQGTDGKRRKFETHGGNTVGVRNRVVYQWRKDLLKERPPELDQTTPAPDIAAAEEVFIRGTDEALRSTIPVIKETPQQFVGSPIHLEVAKAALIVGPAEFRGYTEVHRAVQARNWEQLAEAVRKTPWHRRDPESAERFIERMSESSLRFDEELYNARRARP